MTHKRLGNALTERGVERYHSCGTWYRNIGLAVEQWKDRPHFAP